MDEIPPPPMERRLQQRYQRLVQSHLHAAPAAAPGPTALLGSHSAFAQTQAMWRFLNNDRVTLQALVEPPRQAVRQALAEQPMTYLLVAHDWCKVDFGRHGSKLDTVQLTHQTDVGYELTTALAISTRDGSPLAPIQMHLKTAARTHSTSVLPPQQDTHHLEQILPTMRESASWELGAKLVHVIDREADSVGHLRRWEQEGHLFLVRADDRRVLWQGQSLLLWQIAARLQKAMVYSQDVEYRGKKARQFVGQTQVTLHRPAKRRAGGRQREVPGPALTLRLVIAQVRGRNGKTLATWMLLTNLPASQVNASQIALWYYWRWRIETYFKLLKSAGQQLEYWQQESGKAVARRLLVASMACVLAWKLQREQGPQAEEFKQLLVRLSGRQVKRHRPPSASVLLAGLFVLLPILQLIDESGGSLDQIKKLALSVMPFLAQREDV